MSDYSKQVETQIKNLLHESEGLITKPIGDQIVVCYMTGMVDNAQLNFNVIGRLLEKDQFENLDMVSEQIAIGDCKKFDNLSDAIEILLSGFALVLMQGNSGGVGVNIAQIPSRSPSNADTESTIYGPLEAFTESMEQNIALLRSYITSPDFIQEQIQLDSETKTLANMLYLKDENVNPFINIIRKRISKRKIKGLIGSPLFLKLLTDNKYALFPEMSLSERPDRTAQAILEGKVVVMVEGNSQVIIGPSTFFDFFQSVEDRYSTWGIGTFNRILRAAALFITIFLTPMYVAALTFHYEVIPVPLLEPLLSTRSRVPFPPLIEALVMEISIELLREAGARLPTKVGQTMGIVGGIVIGQAAVQAGFTSNILIMLVAFAALGSFTTPNYMMGSSIRIIRFPMLIAAGMLGFVGIAFFTGFLLIHLLRMTSYGKPFLYPLYPPNSKEIISTLLITDSALYEYKTKLTQSNILSWKSRLFKILKSDEE
ncbi:spore germination protein [Paenibacillus sp. Marseille-Q4541]|uniref:spore germination protein n=1 Tax=Paenibacillus sp. Marseille-Q4541 TaxID=2831522 RepID=UPI001BA9F16E|nr:spore germination protein [Paenibacillus sp. Marseille-Q4541]